MHNNSPIICPRQKCVPVCLWLVNMAHFLIMLFSLVQLSCCITVLFCQSALCWMAGRLAHTGSVTERRQTQWQDPETEAANWKYRYYIVCVCTFSAVTYQTFSSEKGLLAQQFNNLVRLNQANTLPQYLIQPMTTKQKKRNNLEFWTRHFDAHMCRKCH